MAGLEILQNSMHRQLSKLMFCVLNLKKTNSPVRQLLIKALFRVVSLLLQQGANVRLPVCLAALKYLGNLSFGSQTSLTCYDSVNTGWDWEKNLLERADKTCCTC